MNIDSDSGIYTIKNLRRVLTGEWKRKIGEANKISQIGNSNAKRKCI